MKSKITNALKFTLLAAIFFMGIFLFVYAVPGF